MFEIVTIIVTPFQQNCRLLACPETKDAVVIDPGGDAARIADALDRRGLSLRQIWLTHSHLDHCGGVAELKAGTNAVLFGHPLERELRANVRRIGQLYGLPPDGMQDCPEPDEYIEGEERLSFSKYDFDVLFTPGHSPGHLCFHHAPSKTLFAGDTLFAGSIGRTDLPGGSHQTLLESIRDRILTLPDDTRVLPGHGPDTTIGVERAGNPFVIGL